DDRGTGPYALRQLPLRQTQSAAQLVNGLRNLGVGPLLLQQRLHGRPTLHVTPAEDFQGIARRGLLHLGHDINPPRAYASSGPAGTWFSARRPGRFARWERASPS